MDPKKLTPAERVVVANALNAFKFWWNAPSASADEERGITRLLDAVEALAAAKS